MYLQRFAEEKYLSSPAAVEGDMKSFSDSDPVYTNVKQWRSYCRDLHFNVWRFVIAKNTQLSVIRWYSANNIV